MELTAARILIAFTGVFLISFMRGAFGGGFAVIGIPLLSIVMDPIAEISLPRFTNGSVPLTGRAQDDWNTQLPALEAGSQVLATSSVRLQTSQLETRGGTHGKRNRQTPSKDRPPPHKCRPPSSSPARSQGADLAPK
jgi:hypothetical protein